MTPTPWWWCTWQNKNKSSPTSSNSQTSLLKFNCCSVLYSNPAYIDLPSQLDLEVAILCITSCQTFTLDSDQEDCLPLPVPPAQVILLFHLPRSSSCPTCRVPCSTNTLAHKINPLPWLPTSCSPSPVSLSLSWSTTPPSQPLSLTKATTAATFYSQVMSILLPTSHCQGCAHVKRSSSWSGFWGVWRRSK